MASDRPDDTRLARILESGLRAPSAENLHYLAFALRPEGVDLLTTDAATWATQPHRRMLAMLSYGAVIENMRLTSGALGLAQVATLLPDPARADCIAELRWSPSPDHTTADPLEAAIPTRHTNRRFYRRGPLPQTSLDTMAGAAGVVAEAGVVWLDGSPKRAQALQAIRVAEAERFLGPRLHQELFGAVRFDLGWRATTDAWLPPATLEVEPPMRLPFALLRHPAVMRGASRIGAHHMLGLRAGYLPAKSAPHIGLVWAGGSGDAAALAAGRAFERAWLAAATLGLALQPMAAATALARQKAGDGWVRPAVQQRLATLLAGLVKGQPGDPFLLFRVGRAAAPSAVTGRRPWRDYLAD